MLELYVLSEGIDILGMYTCVSPATGDRSSLGDALPGFMA